MPIEVTVKRRPKINPASVIAALNAERARWTNEVVTLYGLGVHDWKQQPEFSPKYLGAGSDHDVINIYAQGETSAIYRQIDEGFLRYVQVTDDYISKTLPGVLTSRPGRGGVKRGYKGVPLLLTQPMPVIPRQFTNQIANRIRPDFLYRMRAAFKSSVGSA